MPRKKKSNPEHYEYVRAIVNEGKLRWEYRLNGSAVSGHQSHDEDVSGWSDTDIKSISQRMLDVLPDDPVEVEVIYG